MRYSLMLSYYKSNLELPTEEQVFKALAIYAGQDKPGQSIEIRYWHCTEEAYEQILGHARKWRLPAGEMVSRALHYSKFVAKPESWYRDKLKMQIGGQTEVCCRSGRIDLLNGKYIIEVKAWPAWKSAIGQTICYNCDLPGYARAIALIGEPPSSLYEHIARICSRLGVVLFVLDYETGMLKEGRY